ncbi:hypothetical protein [Streptomyces rimosus]|uniref:hypothetical protein n=1 Tax=Streptomyces rimosus TaxID=1927 RepID=UPI00131C554D|nr:hypothetical protein [Streptomyces rimosus]
MTNFFCRIVGVNRGQRPFFTTWTQEMSAPYRRSDRTYVVRVGFLKGIAVGRYNRMLAGEDAAMLSVFRMEGADGGA